MTQNQITASTGAQINLRNDNKVEEYVRALLRDTISGGLTWHASRAYCVPAYEFLYENNVIQMVFEEMNGGNKAKLTLYVNKIGNLSDIGSMVVQLQTDKQNFALPDEDDPLILLWRAVKAQATHAKEQIVFDHIDTYLSRSKQTPSADELVAVVEWACEELLDAIKDYRETQ